MAAHDALLEWWQRTSQQVTTPEDAERSVAALEARYGLTLPDDFRSYLLHAAPAEDLWDDGDITWWSLDRIKNIPDEYQGELTDGEIAAESGKYLFFADLLCWCWAWAICCSDGPNRGRVAEIGSPDKFVAESFSAFVEIYLRRPRLLVGGDLGGNEVVIAGAPPKLH